MTLEAELTRGGRSTSFAGVRGLQKNPVFEARLTFGTDGESPSHRPDSMPAATAPEETPESPPAPHFQPRFTGHAEYRPLAGRALSGEAPRLLLWMREASGAPLDAVRLCFLLDAIYPAFYATVDRPMPAASVDLRYDFAGPIAPEDAPDGWVLMEFVTRDFANGWAIEDGTAWSRAGRLLATARQLRKTLAKPPRTAI
jgi:acyl-CoA thioesterase